MLPIGDPTTREDVSLASPVLLTALPLVTDVDMAHDYLVMVEYTRAAGGTNVEVVRAGLATPDAVAPTGTQFLLEQLVPTGSGVPTIAFIRCPVRHGEGQKGLFLRSSNSAELSSLTVSVFRQDVTHPVITDSSVMLIEGWRLVDLFNLTEGEQRVAGATLTITNNSNGTGVVTRAVSNDQGVARIWLMPGTYYRWAQHTQFTFDNPFEFEVEPED